MKVAPEGGDRCPDREAPGADEPHNIAVPTGRRNRYGRAEAIRRW